MSVPDLTPEEFAATVRDVLRIVGDEIIQRGMLPLVLIAGDGKNLITLPCGPGTEPANIGNLLLHMGQNLIDGQVDFLEAITEESMTRPSTD